MLHFLRTMVQKIARVGQDMRDDGAKGPHQGFLDRTDVVSTPNRFATQPEARPHFAAAFDFSYSALQQDIFFDPVLVGVSPLELLYSYAYQPAARGGSVTE